MARFALRLALLACVLGATSARRSWSPRASPAFVSAPSPSRAPVVPPPRVAQQQPRGGAVAVSMLAGSTIAGIAAGVGGLAVGIGVIAFTEKQGPSRTEDHGVIADVIAVSQRGWGLQPRRGTAVSTRARTLARVRTVE
jgi:hypothetical protein